MRTYLNDQKANPEVMKALQRKAFDYFVNEANPLNGLVVDKTRAGAPASIAAVGLALSSYLVGVERGFIKALPHKNGLRQADPSLS